MLLNLPKKKSVAKKKAVTKKKVVARKKAATKKKPAKKKVAKKKVAKAADSGDAVKALTGLPGVGAAKAQALFDAGYTTPAKATRASEAKLAEIVGPALAKKIIAKEKAYLRSKEVS